MKNRQTILFIALFLLSPLASTRWQDNTSPQGLTSTHINTIFDNADRSRAGSLQDQSLRNALTEAVSSIFATNNYYEDKPMIEAIVQEELLPRAGSQVSQESFRNIVASAPNNVKNFREKIFNHLLDLYEVNELMEDRDIAKEVIQKPDTFGLTYSAYKVLTFRFDDDGTAASSYGDTKSRFENLRDTGYGNREVSQETDDRISNAFNERPSEIIGSTGIDTFDDNTIRTPGKTIEVEETLTQRIEAGVIRGNEKDGLEGEFVTIETKARSRSEL